MYETNDFRKGLKILIDNEPYIVIDFQHNKQGSWWSVHSNKVKKYDHKYEIRENF